MNVFVDTSALFALVDGDDRNHDAARAALETVRGAGGLSTHNYVVLETHALLVRRLGTQASRTLHRDLLPVVKVSWVDPDIHDAGVSASLAAARRSVSLVDWVSFEFMRRNGMDVAFAFDRDFVDQGYRLLPG